MSLPASRLPSRWFVRPVILGIAAFLMLLAAIGFLGIQDWHDWQAASRSVEHSRQVIETLDRVRAYIAELETEKRNYMLDPTYLNPYGASEEGARREIEALQNLVADDPLQSLRAAHLAPIVAAKLRELDEILNTARTSSLEAGLAIIRSMDEIRSQIDQMLDIERLQFAHWQARVDGLQQSTIWLIAAAVVIAIIFAGAAFALAWLEERKRAEEELRRGEAYLTEAQRLSRTGSFGWSVATGDIIWSDETFKIFGYDKVPSITIDMVVQRTHPDDRASVQHTVDRAVKDGKDFSHEYRLLLPNGSVKHVHAVAHAVKDASGNIEFVGAVTDVTATKRAEDALRGSEQRFRDYAEIASDWLWETGPDHRFIHLSEQLAAIGITPALRIGSQRWDFATDLDDEPEKWRLHVATLEAHQPFRGFVFRVAADDGSARYIAASGKPVFDAEGRFLGYRGVGADVTAAVRAEQAEEALHKTQMELAHVARVTTLGELAASIAHEVNQPLTAIVINGEVCLRWLDRAVPDLGEVRNSVGGIIRAGRRASEIIQRLRALSRKTETQKVAVDINDAISEVIPLVQHEVLSHRVSLRLDLAPTLPAVLGDRVQLQQVIINLLVNGMDAMATVTDRSRELVVRSQLDDSGQVLVAVEDSGVGIDPENAKQLFNAFFTTKSSGMGMGLSICRSIIENHGGRLWASRNAGPGATFQFILPRERDETVPAEHAGHMPAV